MTIEMNWCEIEMIKAYKSMGKDYFKEMKNAERKINA